MRWRQVVRLFGRPRKTSLVRARPISIWPRLAFVELEDRVVPSYTWTPFGEGSVTPNTNTVTMGVANRPESGTQAIDFHGASALLPALRKYDVVFFRDLSTWDSYNSTEGLWDSFSVSVTSVPYPQLNILQDPLSFPFVYGGASWTDHVLEHSNGYFGFNSAFNVAGPKYLNVVLDTKTQPTADNAFPSWGTIKVITGDLAIVKADGTELSDDLEQTQGGYVPVNNENANHNFNPDGTPLADKDEAGPIQGDTYLVPMKLHKIDPIDQGGVYRLVFGSDKIKIWQNPDKTGAVTSDATEFDATQDTTVYVEGINPSAARAAEEVQLKWVKDSFSGVLGRVRLTVYQVNGPSDVPDYSVHTYSAIVPGGGTGSWTVANGTIQSGANTNTATILWGGGPVIGKATFSPVAGFQVEQHVDVVQVKIEAPSAGNAFTAGTPSYLGDVNFGVFGPVVSSGAPGIGIVWRAKVTLAGPSENGLDQLGVTRIEVGFVQNVTQTTARGDYTVNGAAQSLTANIQGQSYLDNLNGQPAGTVYYDAGNVFKPTGTAPADRTRDPFTSNDTPTSGVPKYYKKGAALNPPNDAQLDTMHWLGSFTLWITARTDDTVNGAHDIYTARATANWSFAVNEAYPMANPLGNSSVTAPAGWTDVTNGSQPTLRAGARFNDALAGITY